MINLLKKKNLWNTLFRTLDLLNTNKRLSHYNFGRKYLGYVTHHVGPTANTSIQNNRLLTVGECVHLLTTSFECEGVTEARCSAEYIIAHALGQKTLCTVPRNQLLIEPVISRISHYAELRRRKLPVQYVIGEWDFKDLTLTCSPPVFIPRPETEELVDYALSDPVVQEATCMLEVGSGTGAISIYLLTQLPQLMVTAVEISSEACELTSQNARNYNLEDRLNIINTTFKKGISLNDIRLEKKVDVLISNPPYIPHQVIQHLQAEVTMFEDHRALDGGQDGLYIIRNILQMAAQLIKSEGSLWLEVDQSHPRMIEHIVNSVPSLNLHYVKTYDDFYSSPRFCHLKVNPEEKV